MVFKNINFWNVAEIKLDQETNAYRLFRVKEECEANMFDQGKNMNHTSIGVELRFKMIDEEVEIILKTKGDSLANAYIYFGSTQGEWHQSSFVIKNQDTIIKLKRNNVESIRKINELKESIYDSSLLRILFDDKEIQFVDVKGNVEPALELLPKRKYLAYGSSITANSITFHPLLSYPSLLAKELKVDLLNKGFPGSCRMEKEVVDYLATEEEFDFATIELGINIIDDMDELEFYNRASYTIDTISNKHPNSTIFVLDIFNYFNEICGVSIDKLNNYRCIVKNICKELKRNNIVYISSKELLKTRANLCADLVHPDIDGHYEIYQNLSKIIKKHLKNC